MQSSDQPSEEEAPVFAGAARQAPSHAGQIQGTESAYFVAEV